MAKINRLKVGQTVYSIESGRMGNTTMRIKRCYEVLISEIDPEFKWVMAKWNAMNPPTRMYASRVARFRVKEPVAKREIFGQKSY